MQATSDLYKSIFADPAHVVEWKIAVNGTEYTGEQIAAAQTPRLSRRLIDGDEPTIGQCIAATFTGAIYEASSAVPRMATVSLAYRLALPLPEGSSAAPTVSEWITLGTFFIDTRSVDKATKALILSCYDKMLTGSVTYLDVTGFDEWPQSQAAVAAEIASIMGISLDSRTTLRTGTGYMVEYPNDLSCLEVLGYIGVANAGNWCITPANSLRLVPLTGASGSFGLGSAILGDLRTSPALEPWAGVIVYYADGEAYEAGDTSGEAGRVLTCDCPWATQATADGILDAIEGHAYQPYSADGAVIDLALELGDVVTAGLAGATVSGPVFTINVQGGGIERADIAAPGDAEIDHEYPYASYVDRSLKRKVGLGQTYEGVSISRQYGLQIVGVTDGEETNRALLNSRQFTMDRKVGGSWEPQFYFDPDKRSYIFNGALGADALYADQGDIAELTVDELSTSRRVRKYILGDTSDDNYIHVKGQFVRWITGSVISNTVLAAEDDAPLAAESGYLLTEEAGNVATETAVNRYGDPLYWQAEPVGYTADGYPTDADGNRIYATTEHTIWPVTQYRYTELIKTQLAFEEMGANYIPKLILGAGDEFGRSKGYLYKDDDRLILRYNTRSNKDVDITFSDEGFVDAMHRRLSSLILDTDSHVIVYTLEGSSSYYTLGYHINSDTITFTWPDGHTCDINIPDDDDGGGGGGGGGGPTPASSIPQMDGAGTAGVSTLYSRGDHQHPSDTSRQAVITASGILKGNGSGGVSAATPGTDYQAPLTFDSTPTEDSANPVTSGGIYTAILDRMPNSAQIWSGDSSVDTTGTTITLTEEWGDYSHLMLMLNTASGNPSGSRMLVTVPTVSLQFTGYWVACNSGVSGIVRIGRPQYQRQQIVLYNTNFASLYLAAVYGIK